MQPNQIDVERIHQAANFMARLWSDTSSEEDQHACNVWRTSDPANEKAWQCLIKVQEGFNDAPKDAIKIIARSRKISRRHMLSILGLSAGGFILAGSYTKNHVMKTHSNYKNLTTSTGEIKSLSLDSSNRLVMNTKTTLSMPTKNQFKLSEGEFFLDISQATPYQIETSEGMISFSQGQLNIRHTDDITRVSLFSGQDVQLIGKEMQHPLSIKSGESLSFNTSNTSSISVTNPNTIGWVTGKLMAQRMPLTDFIHELSRYRKGVLRVAPELNQLAVTGVFSLNNTDQILQQLEDTLPINILQLTPYWVSVTAS
ncbi:MAG: FecR family protein [Vibrio toranzoniae]|uniref:FecR family protein n=1 Tax=Marinomonas foliarum TaxID=491950 RepID=UPI003F9A28D2